ncbi:MAG: hypothetical protein RLZZ20_2014, partial [Pseudomonadota bacterium]
MPLLLLWPISIGITYVAATSIANEPFDRSLEDRVTVLGQQVREVNGVLSVDLPIPARDMLRADDIDNVYFQVSGPRRELVAWNGSAWTVVSDAPANGPYLKDAASVDVDGDGVATLFATREVVYPAADTTALVRREAGAWIPVDPAQTVSLTGSGNQTGRLAAHDDDGDGVPSLYASVVVGDPGGFVAIGLARFDGKV